MSVGDMLGGGKGHTNQALEAAKTRTLADVVAQEDQVGLQEPPVLWAGCVIEFQTIASSPKRDFENEGLITVS